MSVARPDRCLRCGRSPVINVGETPSAAYFSCPADGCGYVWGIAVRQAPAAGEGR